MKKITTIMLSFVATALFAQTQVNSPQDIAFGVDAYSSAIWDVKKNISIDGNLRFESVGQYSIKLNGGKSIIIGSTGVLDLNSNNDVWNKQNVLNIGNFNGAAYVTIEEGGKLYADKITLSAKGSELTLNASDAIQTVRYQNTILYFHESGILNMFTPETYSFVLQAVEGKTATLTFVENTKLNVMGYVDATNYKMNLVDFTETNSIFFASQVKGVEGDCIVKLEELGSDYKVSFYNGDAVAKTITLQGADLSDFSFTKTTIDGVGGYLLSAVAVPEPAEWAMIFGPIALGLAIYRRRK